ncbi:MAG: T9SS type A sorting domain-containing protein [Flavobacteriales bacterium]|nr:T9SS type A sorting domain-containing protein [Flavobacteriales bacterium]
MTWRTILPLAFLLILSRTSDAQVYQQLVEADFGEGRALDVLPNGDLLLGARYSDFGVGVNAVQLIRFDQFGQSVWGRIITSDLDAQGYLILEDLEVTANGDVLLVGSHENGASVDSAFVIRLDENGTVQWALRFHGNVPAAEKSIAFRAAEAPNGDVVVMGELASDAGLLQGDLFIARISSSGVPLWTERVMAPVAGTFDRSGDLFLPPAGGILIFAQTALFSEGSWLMMLDDSGVKQWVRKYDTNVSGLDLRPLRMFPTASGFDLFYRRNFSISPDIMYRLRTDPSGMLMAAQKYELGAGSGTVNDVAPLSGGGYAIAGDHLAGNTASAVLFLVDGAGVPGWAMSYGTPGYEGARAVQPANGGGYLLAGSGEPDSLIFRGGGQIQTYLLKTDPNGLTNLCEQPETVTMTSEAFTSSTYDQTISSLTGWAQADFSSAQELELVSACVPNSIVEEAKPVLMLHPNPASEFIRLGWTAEESGYAQVSILDLQGRPVQHVRVPVNGSVDIRGLAPAPYVLLATTRSSTYKAAFTIVR